VNERREEERKRVGKVARWKYGCLGFETCWGYCYTTRVSTGVVNQSPRVILLEESYAAGAGEVCIPLS
jgi:hypothetical protein